MFHCCDRVLTKKEWTNSRSDDGEKGGGGGKGEEYLSQDRTLCWWEEDAK